MKKSYTLIMAIIVFAVSNSKAQIPTSGLVAWYPFTGNAIDSSGNGNNGTINGVTLTTDRFGNPNSAYSFSGNSQYISVPNSSSLTPTQITITCWIKALIPQNSDITILSKMNHTNASNFSYGFQIQSKPNYFLKTGWSYGGCGGSGGGTADTGTNKISNGIWTMVTTSITNTGACKNYINGKLVDSFVSKNNPFVPCGLANSELRIGEWWLNDPQWYNGQLDDIRIYNRPLDSVEIQALYHENDYSNTLPLKLTDLTAINNNGKTLVSWSTATELNTSHFIIQHSTDGTSFKEIGNIKAVGKGANSYQFEDDKATTGINYYRLESFDIDGTVTFSKVISVKGSTNSYQLKLAPNPAKNQVLLNFSTPISGNLSIYSSIGLKVLSTKIEATNGNYNLNTNALSNGVYIVVVKTETNTYTQRLLIAK